MSAARRHPFRPDPHASATDREPHAAARAGANAAHSFLMRPSCLLLLFIGFLPSLQAQSGTATAPAVTVAVTCDHPDWRYALGEPVTFAITVTSANGPLADANIEYTAGPEMMPHEPRTVRTGADGRATVPGGTLRDPGFLRCIATVRHEGNAYRGLATAGFAPERIEPTQTEPADFDAFWGRVKAELAALPVDARLTPLPDQGNDQIEVFEVALQNLGTPPARSSRFYGILCVPRGEGPFPALMNPPGAGIRRYAGERAWAERGFITLQVGIHGLPVQLPAEAYQALGAALGGYSSQNLEYRDRYYFRRVIAGCLRALEYLRSQPKWDRKNLIVFGGSQGGYLSIAAAGLDPTVTAIVCAYPAYSDVSGYARGRAGGWPGMRFLADPQEPARDVKLANTAYYDAVNFARRIRAPGHYGFGYNDEVCPPTSMYSAYNVVTAPKVLTIVKEMGHPKAPELAAAERRWLLQHLGRNE